VRETIFDNKTVELGAEWIHVPGHNHIMKKKVEQYKMKFYLDEFDISENFAFRYYEISFLTGLLTTKKILSYEIMIRHLTLTARRYSRYK